MLLRNGAYFNCIAGHNHSGVTSNYNFINPMTMMGWFTPSQNDGKQDQIVRDSFPTGTNPPYSCVLGHKGGLLSSTTQINGDGELSISSLAMGRAIAADLEGSGTITTANLSLIIQMACAILSDGSLSASMVGTIQMASSLAGSGSVTASLSLLASVVSSLTGTGSVTSDLKGKSSLSATIYVNQATATEEGIAAAVWNAVAASFNSAGTMGNKMNAAGSAGDPWSTILPASYTGTQAGGILDQIQTLVDELHRIQGLKAGEPMTVTPTSRISGDIELEISGDGETTTTVERV